MKAKTPEEREGYRRLLRARQALRSREKRFHRDLVLGTRCCVCGSSDVPLGFPLTRRGRLAEEWVAPLPRMSHLVYRAPLMRLVMLLPLGFYAPVCFKCGLSYQRREAEAARTLTKDWTFDEMVEHCRAIEGYRHIRRLAWTIRIPPPPEIRPLPLRGSGGRFA